MTLSETEAVFGPLVEGRDCGGCKVCCEHLIVETPAFSKPAGVLCQHACDAGCGIYETRFPVCRDWFCLWRHVRQVPEAARPDQSGVMWGYAWSDGPHRRFQTAYIHGLCVGGLAALDAPEAQAALAHFSRGDLPVWVSEPGGEMQRVYPTDAEAALPIWADGIRRED